MGLNALKLVAKLKKLNAKSKRIGAGAIRRRRMLEHLEKRVVFDASYFNLGSGNFSQDWSDTSMITADDDWSGVPSIIGYRGDLDNGTNVDPQTLLLDFTTPVVDVIANQTNPNTLTSGGVAEFEIANPVVAFQGSGTADAPHLVLHLNTTGRSLINVSYLLRDIDGSADNALQQVALHYRIGETGDFTNVPAAYVSNASSGPNLAVLETPVSVTLPAAVNDQPMVQVRIMTTNAGGSDEWIGVDDILVTSIPFVAGSEFSIATDAGSESKLEGNSGTTDFTYTVTRSGAVELASSVDWNLIGHPTFPNATASDFSGPTSGVLTFAENEISKTITVQVVGDTVIEPDEGFGIQLSNPPLGSSVLTGTALSVIVNDEFQSLIPGDVVITSVQTLPNPDNFSFVPLVDIQPFMTLRFTDNGWDGQASPAGLNNAEGTVNYVVPAEGLPRGTKVVITQFGDVLSGPGFGYTTPSRLVTPGAFALNSIGDSLFAFTGTESDPSTIQMLFGLTTNQTYIDFYEETMGNTLTFLPPMLVIGVSAIAPLGTPALGGTVQEAHYNHSVTVGTYEELRNAVANLENWFGDNDGVATVPANTGNFTIIEIAPGVIINESNGSTDVVEGGISDTYNVSLITPPSANVTVTITPDAQVDLGAGPGVAITLTFTPQDALTAQTVTVNAVDDSLIEGNHIGIVTHQVVSADSDYNGLVVANINVNITDNDFASVLLNEIYVNPPGGDDNREYVELVTPGSGNISLAGVWLLEIEGDGAAAGEIDMAIDLSGFSTGPNGLLVAGEGYVSNPGANPWTSLIAPGTSLVDLLRPGNRLENGSITFLLVGSFTGAVGQDLDTNNDGSFNITPWVTVIDSVGWLDGGASDFVYSAASLTQLGGGTPDAATRFSGDSTPNSLASWYAGDIIGTGLSTVYSDTQASANLPIGAVITPGDVNAVPAPLVTLSASPLSIPETGGLATVTATLSRASTQQVIVNLATSGTATLDVDYLLSSNQIIIEPGELTGSVTITALSDTIVEGDETIVVDITTTANAVEDGTQQVVITIIDTVSAVAPVVENVLVNNGDPTRSQITSLTVNFNAEVDHAKLQSAFTLTNIDTNQVVASLVIAPTNVGGKTTVVLTFGSGLSVVDRVGSGVLGNSLANGNYRLGILATQVEAVTGGATMLADYMFGGQTAGQPNNDNFFRLYGDETGDGFVDGLDLNEFIATFANSSNFNSAFDSNGDGFIDGLDLNAFIPTIATSRQ